MKKRPSFVKHTIANMIIFGVLFIGLFNIVFSLSLGDFSSPLVVAIMAVYVAIDAALFVAAYGLWTMKPWARKAAIGTIIAVVISGLPGLFSLIIFYRSLRSLFKPETKAAFEGK